MSPASLPRMFLSETEGWPDLARGHTPVAMLTVLFVLPMSLIPPLMHAFAQIAYPGRLTPLVEPPFSAGELAVVGLAFLLAELAMVALMAAYIRQTAETIGRRPGFDACYRLAAVAPTPLWLSALALFVPLLWFDIAVVAAAWVGCVALIHHGVRPLLGVEDPAQAKRVADAVTVAGVAAWIGLMVVLALLLGMLLGWR